SVGNDFAHSLRRSRAAATGCDGAPPHLRRRGGADSDGQTEPARARTHRECALGPVPAAMTQSAQRASSSEAKSLLLRWRLTDCMAEREPLASVRSTGRSGRVVVPPAPEAV